MPNKETGRINTRKWPHSHQKKIRENDAASQDFPRRWLYQYNYRPGLQILQIYQLYQFTNFTYSPIIPIYQFCKSQLTNLSILPIYRSTDLTIYLFTNLPIYLFAILHIYRFYRFADFADFRFTDLLNVPLLPIIRLTDFINLLSCEFCQFTNMPIGPRNVFDSRGNSAQLLPLDVFADSNIRSTNLPILPIYQFRKFIAPAAFTILRKLET